MSDAPHTNFSGLLTAEEMMERIPCSRQKFYQLKGEGLPTVVVGPGCHRFDPAAVHGWLAARHRYCGNTDLPRWREANA